ncbi:alcohol dehydrogenase catalytic domain-containing protein [Amycolatopsis acidiphila]|uniref:Zinc-binding dehydrogenase n=1 Tax=Amycolatopsis acidiphila TaxID=715473 RepID=A0A558A4U5_9PSEU|nr:alcohol dehydrogenase catalytic domain-containing protein [Amycolatopsis acidiphila]TVT19270.1 zinc-binding dehydrogenase [Amycolatopsis acidiphila]UIJ62303.1 alcohol dehydrogenase catalytic domain-containing protein [Amycolatopsis acidiphila]GHG96751.1 sorbitol dehydrogenase [Amycolatopsis acidiphila]
MQTRAAVLHAPGDIRVETVPVREPGEHEVLIEVEAVGLCGSDLHYFESGHNGANELRRPTVLGHEISGTVRETGQGGSLRTGTRVAVEPAVPCGKCRTCREGRYNVCPQGTCLGSPPTDGGIAGLLVVREEFAHELPAGMPADAGAVIEPLAVACWAVRRARVALGERVLVLGAGPIGVLVAQAARAAGAAEVTITDVNPFRLSVAAGLGLHAVRAPELDIAPVDVLIECSGARQAFWSGLESVRHGGRAALVSQAPPTVDGLPLALLQRREIDLLPVFRYAHAFPPAIALAAGGAVRLGELVTATFALEHTADALRAARTDPEQLKIVIHPGD